YESAHREIEGLEADVQAGRSEVFSAINSATALRHALEHAAAARDRVADTLSKLEAEAGDVRVEMERVTAGRTAAADGLRRAQEAIEATRIARTARESELASARIEHDWRARSVRAREHELAGFEARLTSLEELEAARAAGASRLTPLPVGTMSGDVFRGPHLVSGGGREEARGILETKREIKELRERIHIERARLVRLAEEAAGLETTSAHASHAIVA